MFARLAAAAAGNRGAWSQAAADAFDRAAAAQADAAAARADAAAAAQRAARERWGAPAGAEDGTRPAGDASAAGGAALRPPLGEGLRLRKGLRGEALDTALAELSGRLQRALAELSAAKS
jgi:hypothetical protein